MPFNNRTRDILTIATHVLRGSIDHARGRHDAAVAAFTRAVAIQDNLNSGEPPDWYFPVREAQGASLVAAGRLDEAEEVFRADLRQHPRNARSLHGLATTLRHQQRPRTGEASAAEIAREQRTGKSQDHAHRCALRRMHLHTRSLPSAGPWRHQTIHASKDGFHPRSEVVTWNPVTDARSFDVALWLEPHETAIALEPGDYTVTIAIDLATARVIPRFLRLLAPVSPPISRRVPIW